MLDIEGDYFLTFAVDEDRVMFQGGMTLAQIAEAILDQEKVQVRLLREPENRVEHVFVYLSLYQEILRQLGMRETMELVVDSDDDDELDEDEIELEDPFIITWTHLSDGRLVEIAVQYSELLAFVNRQPDETEFVLDYRTRFQLGDDVKFMSLLVPLEAARVLEGVDACYLVDSN